MTKFLWTLHLSAALFCTIMLIMVVYTLLKDRDDANGTQVFFIISTPLLWAIWYMYYLN